MMNFFRSSNFVGAGMNVLAGVGVLTTPYAVKEGGWLGLLLLFVLSAICCYTGILLRRCLESAPGLATYPDIGQAAFGNTGRFIIAVSSLECMQHPPQDWQFFFWGCLNVSYL